MGDMRDDLAHWTTVWEKAQKDGIFPTQEKVVPAETDEENPYWSYFDSSILNEDHAGKPMSKKDAGDQARDMAKVPNPVYHHTIGNDQDLEPWTPNWIDGKELLELAELKKNLYELECEMNSLDANAQKVNSVEKKISTMKQKLHDLSNALTPDRFREILD